MCAACCTAMSHWLQVCQQKKLYWKLLVQVNLSTGALDRWDVGDHSLLAAGISPCLFRAPLDNDLGGSGKTAFATR